MACIRENPARIVVGGNGVFRFFARKIANVQIHAPTVIRLLVTDTDHAVKRLDGVNRDIAVGFAFGVVRGQGGVHTGGQADAIEIPAGFQLQTFDFGLGTVHVLVNVGVFAVAQSSGGIVPGHHLFVAAVHEIDEIGVAGAVAGKAYMSPIAVHIDAQLNVFGAFGFQVRIGLDIKQSVGEIEPHFICGRRAEAGAVFALQGDRRADVPIQCSHIAGRTKACLLVPQAFGFKLAFHVGVETFRIQGVHFDAVVAHTEVQLKAVAEAQGIVPIKIRVIGLSADQELFFIAVGSQAVRIENVCPITGVAVGVTGVTVGV